MTLTELAKRIDLPEEALEAAQMVELSDAEYQTCKELFDRDLGAFLKEWKEKEEPGRYTWALRFYLQLSADIWEQYQAEHIPEEVFDQTFYDLTIWCRECKRKQGIYGLEELWWLAQSVKEHLFRLGRLQFEPIVLKEPLEGNGVRIEAGVKGLNVHIPEGESLAFEKCMDSFRRAEQFFAGRGEGKPEFYMCDSWLLSPALKELLPADSNIIRFQDLFRIVKVHYAFPQAEQRIFGDILEDKSRYPEDTSLRRKAKRYFQEGNDPGIGIGVIEDINKYM